MTPESRPFEGVKVLFGGRRPGIITVVTSARQAAEILLDPKWPAERSRRQLAAQQACLDALEGRKPADVARAAFIAAADEAGVLIED